MGVPNAAQCRSYPMPFEYLARSHIECRHRQYRCSYLVRPVCRREGARGIAVSPKQYENIGLIHRFGNSQLTPIHQVPMFYGTAIHTTPQCTGLALLVDQDGGYYVFSTLRGRAFTTGFATY